jgi:glycosyltransferase involved in cell wall biosynthesis
VTFRVLRWPPKFLWNLIRLSWEMLVHPPDVLFVPAHTVPLVHPKRLVTMCHDVGFERFPSLYETKPIGPRHGVGKAFFSVFVRVITLGRYRNSELDYHRFSMRLALRRAARILVPSQFTEREIRRFYPKTRREIRVIPHGLNSVYQTVISSSQRRQVAEKFGVMKPYLFFLGRWEEKKNISLLLQAYQMLRRSGRPEKLVLGGRPGFGFESAWESIDSLTRQSILLCENVTTEAPVLMSEASVFLFPSAYEGFGMPILEAMASGTPIVASTCASIPEVAGDAAILVDPGNPRAFADAIQRVLTNEELRQTLIDRGLRRAATYSWASAGQETLRALTQW